MTRLPRSLLRGGVSKLAFGYLVVVALLAISAPWIARPDGVVPFDPIAVNLGERFLPPGGEHLLGTDDLGRDLLARMIHGARVSLLIGFIAAFLALVVGSVLGSLAGYYGGAVDWIVSRVIETVVCFPFLFLVLGIVALFEPSIETVIIAVALTTWTSEGRIVRGEFLRVRELDFATAARAAGARDARIIFGHLLPNAISPALISATFGVSAAILTESALSFLGLGVPPPAASWGSILSSADDYLGRAWWLMVFPGLAIFLTVCSCNIVGEWLRDRLDPRTYRAN